jgi:eukaryotic-like serine/threonine-protein kinase
VPEPPSKQLQKVLFGQKLCTPRDVRRCSSRVRRLARDLPTFDSVWLDALVQSRVLTAFQAQAIEADEAAQLTIGPCLVLDRLGHSLRARTCLARHRATLEPCVIKQVSLPIEDSEKTLGLLNKLVEACQQIDHPGLVLPQAVSEDATAGGGVAKKDAAESNGQALPMAAPTTGFNIVSRYCEALSLAQLILRRGRVPAATVLDIARQMLESLAVLHDRKLTHGDVSLSNALLARNGQVVLVDCGVRSTVQPEFHIDAHETPERYDGVAPERIGTGRPASVASDLYALGCLLWHLLAGRSAFPTGDPLARLAAHQTERFPDIREIAPDTPDTLAEAVLWLTEPDPRRRPRSAKEVLLAPKSGAVSLEPAPETTGTDVRSRPKKAKAAPPPRVTLGQSRSRGRRGLSQFAQTFQHPALQTSQPGRVGAFGKSIAAATAAILLAGAALFLFEPNSRTFIATSISAFSGSDLPAADEAPKAAPEIQNLPEPDDFGVIDLPSFGPWRAGQITWTGPSLTIRSTGNQRARLIVESEALQLRASQLTLDGVEIEYRETGSPLVALTLLQSQELTIRNCSFVSPLSEKPVTEATSEPQTRYAIGWQALDPSDRLAGQVTIENSAFVGDWSTVWLAETSKPVAVQNSLKAGPGPFFVFEQPARRGDARSFLMKNVTLRGSGPVVSARLIRNWLWETQLTLTLHDCVIDPATSNGERRPLFLFEGETLPRNWQSTLSIDGSRSFVRPGTTLVGIEKGSRYATLPAPDVNIRGLSSAEFSFRAADAGASVEDSVIDQLYASRRTAEPPGIQTLDGRLAISPSTNGTGELP